MADDNRAQFNLANLTDVETEKSLLFSLMEFNNKETVMALVRLRLDFFFDEGHRDIFILMKEMIDRSIPLNVESVRTEVASRDIGLLKSLQNVILRDPTPAILFAVDALEEWDRKRKLHKGLLENLTALHNSESAIHCAQRVTDVALDVSLTSTKALKNYLELEEEFDQKIPEEVVPLGIDKVDAKLRKSPIPGSRVKGMPFGKFILIMGDPDAGKTSLMLQILRHISKTQKTLFFPFEFDTDEMIEMNRKTEARMGKENFYVEADRNDIHDVAAQIRIFAQMGGKFVGIDSQMAVTNITNKGTSEQRETEKFFILQRLCVSLGLVIFFICQQGKEDARSNLKTPMGSKNGAHFAHAIWYVSVPKDKDGTNYHRELQFPKNKISGTRLPAPLIFNPKTLEFRGAQFDEDSPYSTKTVGSGRKPAQCEEIVYEQEDAQGNVSALETPWIFDTQIEMPKV